MYVERRAPSPVTSNTLVIPNPSSGRERDLTMPTHQHHRPDRTPLPHEAHRTIPLDRANAFVRDDSQLMPASTPYSPDA